MRAAERRDRRFARHTGAGPRRGFTVLVVMVLISVSLALAYTITRSQASLSQVQNNSNLDALARQAALTGFATGLRSMHDPSWAGVSSVLSGTINAGQTFNVSYQTGDGSLAGTNALWPFRITMLAVGTASDPAHPTTTAYHSVKAVLQLVPRQLAPEPTNWSTMVGYTVYQYTQDNFQLQLPCQVAGNVWLQGTLSLASDYPPSNYGQNQYLTDLNSMQFFGYGDNRPLNGTVYLPYNKTASSTLSQVNLLGVSTVNTSPSTASGWSFPGSISSYQLYPGGQAFQVGTCASGVSNTTLAASPRTNPLGLFYASGSVIIGSNVTINGTLVAGGDVTIAGSNVSVQPINLPALDGTSMPIQLPAIVASGNFYVANKAQATLNGLVAAWNSFTIQTGSQQTSFAMLGRVICKGFNIQDRTEWTMSGGQWNSLWTQFGNQLNYWWQRQTVYFYPQWAQQQDSLNYAPSLTVAPETTPVTYHWKDATSPVYIANPADAGLRWTVMSWTDSF